MAVDHAVNLHGLARPIGVATLTVRAESNLERHVLVVVEPERLVTLIAERRLFGRRRIWFAVIAMTVVPGEPAHKLQVAGVGPRVLPTGRTVEVVRHLTYALRSVQMRRSLRRLGREHAPRQRRQRPSRASANFLVLSWDSQVHSGPLHRVTKFTCQGQPALAEPNFPSGVRPQSPSPSAARRARHRTWHVTEQTSWRRRERQWSPQHPAADEAVAVPRRAVAAASTARAGRRRCNPRWIEGPFGDDVAGVGDVVGAGWRCRRPPPLSTTCGWAPRAAYPRGPHARDSESVPVRWWIGRGSGRASQGCR
jgi:hypothetical protein